MKKYLPIIALLAYAAPYGVAVADGADPALPSDNRIKVLMYDESDVYTIVTKYGYQTNLVFAPDEEIQTISMGERSLWQIIPSGHRLFIRPMDENVTTNMTILTNKRSYQFDLKSLGEGKDGTPIYVAKFMYPEDLRRHKAAMLREPAPAPAPVAAPVSAAPSERPFTPVVQENLPPVQPAQTNYNYTYTGPDALAPTQVYDDGRSTYIKFKKMSKPAPKAYIIAPDGSERAVNYFTKNNQIVVDEIFGTLVLKHTAGAVTIYNEVINPK